MAKRAAFMALATMLSLGVFGPSLAQDAAETAIILGGSGHSAAGAGGLSDAISKSFNHASAAIGGSGARSVSHRPATTSARPRAAHAMAIMTGPSDPFAGIHAPVYKMSNGVSISASGGLTPEPGLRCVRDCR
jgi:hypothetical protein